MAQPQGKTVPQCDVIEREDDGRWVLYVNGTPRLVLPAALGRGTHQDVPDERRCTVTASSVARG
jgi:hypothetical protein